MELGFDAAARVASGELTPEQAYNEIINDRAQKFNLDPTDPVEYAVIRLAGMRHTRSIMKTGIGENYDIQPQHIVRFLEDSDDPSKAWKNELVQNLNRSGYGEDGPAISIGFAPDAGDAIAKGGITDPQEFLEVWTKNYFQRAESRRNSSPNGKHAA